MLADVFYLSAKHAAKNYITEILEASNKDDELK